MEYQTEILLGKVSSQFHWMLQNHLNKVLHPYGLTIVHFRVMGIIEKNDACSQNYLVRETHKTKPAITTLVENMVNRGLVLRVNDPENRRTNQIYLTPKGRELLKKTEKVVTEAVNQITKDVPEKDLRITIQTLNKLSENLMKKA